MSRARAFEPIVSRAFLHSMHPVGATQRIRQVGVTPPSAEIDESADVILLAPSLAQIRNRKWREAAVARSASAVASGAMLYVVAPGVWRLVLAASLRKQGLTVGRPFIHMGDGAARSYVPLSGKSLRFALATWPRSRRWWWVVRLLEAVPGSAAVLTAILPEVGFVAHDKVEPFAWLLPHLSGQAARETIVATSWRGAKAPTLVFAFDKDHPKPALVAKCAPPDCWASARHEAAMLAQLGPSAEKAGMRVPLMVAFTEHSELALLLQTAVPGRPMSRWIAEGHGDFGGIVDRLSAWLRQWHLSTVEHVELTSLRCEQLILSAARTVVDALDGGAAYLDWLSAECARLVGRRVPLVATHNDLTMTNILGDEDGCCGVVDWESAHPQGLPLADFWYTACEAATAIGGGDRLSAFKRCFGEDGTHRLRVAPSEDRLRGVVGGPAEWIDLCFHACWLRHAANEEMRATSTKDASFLDIVDVLARSVTCK